MKERDRAEQFGMFGPMRLTDDPRPRPGANQEEVLVGSWSWVARVTAVREVPPSFGLKLKTWASMERHEHANIQAAQERHALRGSAFAADERHRPWQGCRSTLSRQAEAGRSSREG